ncbi:MAG: hypothetical protein PF489_12120 [Salinivirgaceae bacterium]|jgi:hypothetical protein|nr:hypothetical protein [Salinivirgaceae bacterium]
MESKVINNKIELIQRVDQIYVYKALNECTLDMETAMAMTKVGDEWNGKALCANLLDIRDMLFVDSKVRDYAAAQYRPHVAGLAILTGSVFNVYFANLFMKFSNPKVPTKLFNDENAAIVWLKVQMEKQKKTQVKP